MFRSHCFDLDIYATFKLNIPSQSIWNPKGSRIWNVWPSLLFKSSFYYILFLWLIFCCHPIFLIFHQNFFTSVFGNCILCSRLSVILTCISLLHYIIELHCKIMASNFLICYSVVCLLKLFSGKIQAFYPLWISSSCRSIYSKSTEHWSSAADCTDLPTKLCLDFFIFAAF